MLKFCNNYKTHVQLCLMYYSPGCPDGGDWSKKGWWNLEPGQCAVVYGDDLEDLNRYWGVYAEADDGVLWHDNSHSFPVPYRAFDWCINTGSSDSRDVGFIQLDIGDNDDATYNLVGPS